MNASNLHLNLLRDAEKVSSSPVRLRVMLPILALMLCVGCAIWWAVLFMQMLLLRGQVATLRTDLEGKKSAHAAILGICLASGRSSLRMASVASRPSISGMRTSMRMAVKYF